VGGGWCYCYIVSVVDRKASLSEVISIDPDVMHGAPCFAGTRVPVRLLVNDLKSGYTVNDFLEGCPSVSREQVDRYLELAQELVAECAS
jgi:uncharacterized protein (DUF433 family)